MAQWCSAQKILPVLALKCLQPRFQAPWPIEMLNKLTFRVFVHVELSGNPKLFEFKMVES